MKLLSGLGVLLVLMSLFVLWIRCSNASEEKNEEIYNGIMERLAKPMPLNDAYILWKKAYNVAGDGNERRWCLGKAILCKERKGEFSEAMTLLNDFEEEFEVSTPTIIHKAVLYSKMGQQHKANSILDSIVSARDIFQEPSLWEDIIDALLLGGKKAHVHEAYMNFFNEYVYKVVALSLRAGMETDSLKSLECLCKFDNIARIDPYVRDYASFVEENEMSLPISFFLNEEKRLILHKVHLCFCLDSWDPEEAVDYILRFKWSFLQMYLDAYDRCYGYNKTKAHFKRILKENGLASEGYQKHLVDAYMNIGLQNNKYNLCYEDFKKLRRGWGRIVILSPTTLLNRPSAFINAGVTKPCVLLSCNSWNICKPKLFTSKMVRKDKGKVKMVIILKDDFTTDTLRIKDNRLGVIIDYRLTTFMTIDLLQRRFFIGRNNDVGGRRGNFPWIVPVPLTEYLSSSFRIS